MKTKQERPKTKMQAIVSTFILLTMTLHAAPAAIAFDPIAANPLTPQSTVLPGLSDTVGQNTQSGSEKTGTSTEFLSGDNTLSNTDTSGWSSDPDAVLLHTYEVRRPNRTVQAYTTGTRLILKDVNTNMTVTFAAPGIETADQITQLHNLLIMKTNEELLVINLHSLTREQGEATKSNADYMIFESNLPVLTDPFATKSYFNVISKETAEVAATYSKHNAGKNGEALPVIKPDVSADGTFVTYSARFIYAGTGGQGGFTYVYSRNLTTGQDNPVLSVSDHIDVQTAAENAEWKMIGGQQHYAIRFANGTEITVNLATAQVAEVKKTEYYADGTVRREIHEYYEDGQLTLSINDYFTSNGRHHSRETLSLENGVVTKRQNITYDLITGNYVNWVSTTYDTQGRRLEQRTWQRSAQGVMLAYEQISFNPETGIKTERTTAAYDNQGRKNRSWHQTFHANGNVSSSTANIINVISGLTERSSTYFYTDQGSLYRWVGKTFYESGALKSIDDRRYQNGAQISRDYITYDEAGNRTN